MEKFKLCEKFLHYIVQRLGNDHILFILIIFKAKTETEEVPLLNGMRRIKL